MILRYMFMICALLFFACKDSYTGDEMDLSEQDWLFNTEYIKTINEYSWEKISISAMNDYKDFKIDFSFISTGKPRTCGLYAKGIFVDSTLNNDKVLTHTRKFLLRPNVIPNTTILITKKHNDNNGDFINIAVSNMIDFIQSCGDSHQYVEGDYIPSQGQQ